jgi:hypothetical protein
MLVSSGTMASPNSSGSNSDQPSRSQVHRKNIPGMVWIQGGRFLMETNDKESFLNEPPAHLVNVKDF